MYLYQFILGGVVLAFGVALWHYSRRKPNPAAVFFALLGVGLMWKSIIAR